VFLPDLKALFVRHLKTCRSEVYNEATQTYSMLVSTNHACFYSSAVNQQGLTWLHLSYEQHLLRFTSLFLYFLHRTGMFTTARTWQCSRNTWPLINCPTFLARIRATRRVVSDGPQFSPNAFMAEHSSLCMAQSPFFTQANTHRTLKRFIFQLIDSWDLSIFSRAGYWQFISNNNWRTNSWQLDTSCP